MSYTGRLALFLGVMSLYSLVLGTLFIWGQENNGEITEPIQFISEPDIVEELTQAPRPEGVESARKLSWWYKSAKDHSPALISEEFAELVKKYGGIWQGDTGKKCIYLTFDEGYENGYTASILDTLRAKKVTAGFFITGSYLKKNTELVRRMLEEGHIVGSHSQNHKSMPLLTEDEMEEEIMGLAREFEQLTGRKIAPYFRPPMGEFNELSLWKTSQKGFYSVFWSFAYKDWEVNSQKGRGYAYARIMADYHPGALLLLHAVSRDNAEALPEIIDSLKELGYEFLPLSMLPQK